MTEMERRKFLAVAASISVVGMKPSAAAKPLAIALRNPVYHARSAAESSYPDLWTGLITYELFGSEQFRCGSDAEQKSKS